MGEKMASVSEKCLIKNGRMTKSSIQCQKCSTKLETTSASQTIYCGNCDTYNLVPGTAPQSSIVHARGCRSTICGSSLQINKQISNFGHDSHIRSNKRALLCGVSYKGLKYRLRGTVNDVNKMEDFLTKTYRFPKQSIRILTEDQPKQEDTPTKKNIENALKWLVEGCQAGDSLVFYFSGHGLRQPDFVGDEKDGYDETLCPVDFRKEGMILDNDINTIIVKPLPAGVKLHAIIDACHSGTILDLHYIYNRKKKTWEEDIPPSGRPPKGTNGGLAICFSACEDGQRAVDTTVFSEKRKHIFSRRDMNGAMTSLFIQAVDVLSEITYAKILDFMNDNINKINTKRGCLNRPSFRRLFSPGLLQEPQLSSSKDFDVNQEFKL